MKHPSSFGSWVGSEIKLFVDFASKVYCICTPVLRSNGDDEGPAVVKDVGATERASLVGVRRRDGVFNNTTLVEMMRTS